MRGSSGEKLRSAMKRSKRVNWAPNANLCQVKTFRAEDRPSAVGAGASIDLPRIPLVPWTTPLRINVNVDVPVAAGEESEEAKVQAHRVARIQELWTPYAPRPPRTSYPNIMEDESYDDSKTPLIQTIPIEEVEAMKSVFKESASSNILDDPMVAAVGAAIAIIRKKNPEYYIDPVLLRKLLQNPKLIEKLAKDLSDPPSSTTAETLTYEIIGASSVVNNSTNSGYGSGNFREAIQGPTTEPAAFSKSTTLGSPRETGMAYGRKPDEQPIHVVSSTSASSIQKPTSDHNIQRFQKQKEVQPSSVNNRSAATHNIRTPAGSNLVTAGLTSGVLHGNPYSQHWQTAATTAAAAAARTVPVDMTSVSPSSSTLDLSKNKFPEAEENRLLTMSTPLSLSSSAGDPVSANLKYSGTLPTALQKSSTAVTTTTVSSSEDNYFRFLVRKHGETESSGNADPSRLVEPQSNKPRKNPDCRNKHRCRFYNLPAGCRNGDSCPYKHSSDGALEDPDSKRMRPSGRFTKKK